MRSAFLDLGPFPRLVLNWKWAWNAGKTKRRAGSVAPETLKALRRFYAPFNEALVTLLRKRGQPAAADAASRWDRG